MSRFSNLDIITSRREYEEYHETAESLREGYDIGQETVKCVACDAVVPKEDAHRVPSVTLTGRKEWLCDDCFETAGLVHCVYCGEVADKSVCTKDLETMARLKGEYWLCPVCTEEQNGHGVPGA